MEYLLQKQNVVKIANSPQEMDFLRRQGFSLIAQEGEPPVLEDGDDYNLLLKCADGHSESENENKTIDTIAKPDEQSPISVEPDPGPPENTDNAKPAAPGKKTKPKPKEEESHDPTD